MGCSGRERKTDKKDEILANEKASRFYNRKLARKALMYLLCNVWQNKTYQLMNERSKAFYRIRKCQSFFVLWRIQLLNRRREVELTDTALWHWSLILQAKVLRAWQLWVTECRQNREHLTEEVHRDELPENFMAQSCDFSCTLAQNTYEQLSQPLPDVVRRYALYWKQRALCKPVRTLRFKDRHHKKCVSFSLPEDLTAFPTSCFNKSQASKQMQEDSIVSHWFCDPPYRLQLRPDDRLQSPAKHLPQTPWISSQPPQVKDTEFATVSPSYSPSSLLPLDASPLESCAVMLKPKIILRNDYVTNTGPDILMIPSSFTSVTCDEQKCTEDKKPSMVSTTVNVDNQEDDAFETDNLSIELLDIRQEMQQYQHDRKELKMLREQRKILYNWLQTTGIEEENEEREGILKELNELEGRISCLSLRKNKQKPTMILYAARINIIQTQLPTKEETKKSTYIHYTSVNKCDTK